jgi:T4-like virus tail tube protein gp19
MKGLCSKIGSLSAALLLVGMTASCAPDDDAGGDGEGLATANRALVNKYRVQLEVSGVTPGQKTIIGGFKSMSGLDSETELLAGGGFVPAGGFDPGPTVVTLATGASPDAGLLEWYKRVKDGLEEPHGGSITVLDQDLTTVVAKYVFKGASPLSLSATLSPPTSAMAIEKVELCTEKVERVLR